MPSLPRGKAQGAFFLLESFVEVYLGVAKMGGLCFFLFRTEKKDRLNLNSQPIHPSGPA